MKMIYRALVVAMMFFVCSSTVEAQTSKGKKQSTIKKAKTKSKQKSKNKFKVGEVKESKTKQTDKGSYQSGVLNPLLKDAKFKGGQAFETDDQFKTCIEGQLSKANWYQKKYGFGKSYTKWKKGSSLTSSDKKRLLGQASKCEKSGSKSVDEQGSQTKKGYKNSGKTGKGASKGKVG